MNNLPFTFVKTIHEEKRSSGVSPVSTDALTASRHDQR